MEQDMIKVFVGGSRGIIRLSDDVLRRIDRIIEQRLPVLIGDASGTDKAVQQYLNSRRYDKAEVFCTGGNCRNNVGNWPLRTVSAPNNRKDFNYFAAKDQAMADEASCGFMIWDGRSAGTFANVLRLVSQRKKVVVYIAPEEKFSVLTDGSDWDRFVSRYRNRRQNSASRTLAHRQECDVCRCL